MVYTLKEDLTKGVLISATGCKYYFTPKLYLKTVKFLIKKFDLTIYQAKSQLNYYIINNFCRKKNKIIKQFDSSKKTTDARINNIIELDYNWTDLF